MFYLVSTVQAKCTKSNLIITLNWKVFFPNNHFKSRNPFQNDFMLCISLNNRPIGHVAHLISSS